MFKFKLNVYKFARLMYAYLMIQLQLCVLLPLSADCVLKAPLVSQVGLEGAFKLSDLNFEGVLGGLGGEKYYTLY